MIDQIQKTLVKIDPQVNKNSKDSIKSKDIDNSINQKKIRYSIVKNTIDVKSIIFDLNSRPPPSLI